MSIRSTLGAALALTLLATSVGPAAYAQTEVERAQSSAESAGRSAEDAHRIVTSRVADRDAIEARLFEAMDRYDQTSRRLADTNQDLDRVSGQVMATEAHLGALETAVERQAIASYMAAVAGNATLVWSTDGVEDALVAGQVLADSQRASLERLDDLEITRRNLESLRADLETTRDLVSALQAEIEAEAQELDTLFAQADAAVVDAYRQARQAEARHRAALDDLAAAKEREAERRRREEERRRREAAGSGGSSGRNLRASVERWRPTVTAHFPAQRVEEALQVMQCESHGDPNARNPYSSASGLFQFLSSTWAVSSVRAGVGGRSVFDGEANIIAAAWLMNYYVANGHDPWRAWSCKPWSYG